MALTITIRNPGQPDQEREFDKPFVTVGGNPVADLFLPNSGSEEEFCHLILKEGKILIFSNGTAEIQCNSRPLPVKQTVQVSEPVKLRFSFGTNLEILQTKNRPMAKSTVFQQVGDSPASGSFPDLSQNKSEGVEKKTNQTLLALICAFIFLIPLTGLLIWVAFGDLFSQPAQMDFVKFRLDFYQYASEIQKSPDCPLSAKNMIQEIQQADQEAAAGQNAIAKKRFQDILTQLVNMNSTQENNVKLDKKFIENTKKYTQERIKFFFPKKNDQSKGTSLF